MAPPVRGNTHPITAYYSVYRPRKDERLSRPGWLLTYQNKVLPRYTLYITNTPCIVTKRLHSNDSTIH